MTIHEFVAKWRDKFSDPDINYLELVEGDLGDDCASLGFEMDSGHAFSEKYGDAVHDVEALERIIDQVTDISLLGSAIFSRWRYFNHWAYSGAEILEPKNRAWFTTALNRLGELADRQLFQGELRKVRIVSCEGGFGPPPEPDEEVEQHITINAEGRVWFSAYNFGSIPGKQEKSRSKIFKIDKDAANKVLSSIARYFSTDPLDVFATDIGMWELEMTNTEGDVYQFKGSLCANFEVDRVDLSDMIREALGMDDLYVFDGNNKPDRVDRVTIDYHRITKREGKNRFIWNYTEKLVLDRESETIEHIQNIGLGCVVSRKYYVQGGVEGLLDEIDPDDLFGEIEGNPEDVAENPLGTNDYTITVEFKKGPQRVIQGSYDKKGLPEYWGEFADEIWEFMRFYGWGEVLDPAIYRKVRHRKGDYIYCSVKFGGGWKSYYYIADDDEIEVGDDVLVPVGNEGRLSVAEVVKVEHFTEETVPMPVEKTKHIIRKCTDDDFDPPEEED